MTLETRNQKPETRRFSCLSDSWPPASDICGGTTLVETIVLIAISTIALLALINLFLIFNSIYGYQRAFIATAGSAGSAISALEAAVLPAERVLALRSFSGTTYTSTTTSLVLELPAVDASGNLILGAKDYIAFYVSSTTLYHLIEADAGSVRLSGVTTLSTTLSSLSFSYDNADFAQVTRVTAEVETSMLFKTELIGGALRGQWYLRNYSP